MVIYVWDMYNLGKKSNDWTEKKSETENGENPDCTKPVTADPSSYSGDTQATLIIMLVWRYFL